MSNRREFLQLTLAASALPALAARNEPIGSGPLAQNGPRVRVDDVIVESTSPMAIAFGNEAMRFGLEVQGITDDVTDLWYQHLAVRWNRGSAVVAGLTFSTSLFCLETLANDSGMRLWFRADHAALANGAGPTRGLRRPTVGGTRRRVPAGLGLRIRWSTLCVTAMAAGKIAVKLYRSFSGLRMGPRPDGLVDHCATLGGSVAFSLRKTLCLFYLLMSARRISQKPLHNFKP